MVFGLLVPDSRDATSFDTLVLTFFIVALTCGVHLYVKEPKRSLTAYLYLFRFIVLAQDTYQYVFKPGNNDTKSALILTSEMRELHRLLMLVNFNFVEAVRDVSNSKYIFYNIVCVLLFFIFCRPVQLFSTEMLADVLRFIRNEKRPAPAPPDGNHEPVAEPEPEPAPIGHIATFIDRFVLPASRWTIQDQWLRLELRNSRSSRQAKMCVFLCQRALLLAWYIMTNRFFLAATVTYHTEKAISYLTGVIFMYPHIFFEIWCPINLVVDICNAAVTVYPGRVCAGLIVLIPCVGMSVLTSHYMYTSMESTDRLLMLGYAIRPGTNTAMMAVQFLVSTMS
jgi:hypothetical protein